LTVFSRKKNYQPKNEFSTNLQLKKNSPWSGSLKMKGQKIIKNYETASSFMYPVIGLGLKSIKNIRIDGAVQMCALENIFFEHLKKIANNL